MSISRLAAFSLVGMCCFDRYTVLAFGKLKEKHYTEEEPVIMEPVFDDVIHAPPVMGTVTEEWAPPVFYKKPKYEIEQVPIYYKEKIPVYYKGKEQHKAHSMHNHNHHMTMNDGNMSPYLNGPAYPPVHIGDNPDTAPHDLAPHEMMYSQTQHNNGFPPMHQNFLHEESQVRPFDFGTPSTYGPRQDIRYPTHQVPLSNQQRDNGEIEWVHAPFADEEFDDEDSYQHNYYITPQEYAPHYVPVEHQQPHAYVPVRCGLDKMCIRLL